MRYYVYGQFVYGPFDEGEQIYPLVKISVDEAGAFTVANAGGGVAELPSGYFSLELWEVAKVFQIVVDNPYEPGATTDAPTAVSINLDAGTHDLTVVASPEAGDWSDVASSDTGVVTVSESGGVFTLTPVAEGTATLTGTFTATDTDFATVDISVEVTVVKRTVTIDAIRDYQIVKGEGGEGATNAIVVPVTVLGGLAPATVEAYVSDGSEVSISVDGADITVTPSADYIGKSTITVYATKADCNPSEAATFDVEVCTSQTGAFVTTPSAVSDKKHGETTTLTFAPASGASIVEFNTSDPTHVGIVSYSLAAGTVEIEMLGVESDTANITATAQKRGYGQLVSGNVAITIAAD